MKKLLSIVMLVCIVMSMCTVSAWADKLSKPNATIQEGSSGIYSSVITFNFDDSVLKSGEWEKILTDYGAYGYGFVMTSNKSLPSGSVELIDTLTQMVQSLKGPCYPDIQANTPIALDTFAIQHVGLGSGSHNNLFTASSNPKFQCIIDLSEGDLNTIGATAADPLVISLVMNLYERPSDPTSAHPAYEYTIIMYPGSNTYSCTMYDTPLEIDGIIDSPTEPIPNPDPGVNPNPAPVPPAAPVVEDIYYIPATDDNSNMALWSILALALLSTAFVTRKRKNEN